jgi:hypothetical protein
MNQIRAKFFLYVILSCGYISPESTKKIEDNNLCIDTNGITCKVNDPNTKTTNTKNTDVQSIATVDDFKYEATDSDFAVSKTLVGPFILNNHRFRALELIGNVSGSGLICEKLKLIGILHAKRLKVKHAVMVGCVDIKFGTFYKLEVSGNLFLDRAKVNELIFTESTSKKQTDVASISKSNIGSIDIYPSPKYTRTEKQTLLLTGTLVKGDIRFASGNGLVLLDRSQIEGEVIGGKVEQMSNSQYNKDSNKQHCSDLLYSGIIHIEP